MDHLERDKTNWRLGGEASGYGWHHRIEEREGDRYSAAGQQRATVEGPQANVHAHLPISV
jgi:hypothetical protein